MRKQISATPFAHLELHFSLPETSESSTSLKTFLKAACNGVKHFSVRWEHRLNFRFLSTSLQKDSFQAKSLDCALDFLTGGTPETSRAMFHDYTCSSPVENLGKSFQHSNRGGSAICMGCGRSLVCRCQFKSTEVKAFG